MIVNKITKTLCVVIAALVLVTTIGASPSAALVVGGSDTADDTVCVNLDIGYPTATPFILIGSWIANYYEDPCEKFALFWNYDGYDSETLSFRFYGNCSDAEDSEIIEKVCNDTIRIQQSDLEAIQLMGNPSINAKAIGDVVTYPSSGEKGFKNTCIVNMKLDIYVTNSLWPAAQYAIGESCLYRADVSDGSR